MIPIAEPLLGEEELNNVIEAIKSGWISSKGKFIPEFEEKFAGYCGVKYGVATSNGTVALHLALTALGIKEGDEVIVPTLTFIATANTVRYAGATPVFVDSHPDYWCIDPEKVEEAITSRTRAITPVHLYGHPCDMDAILDIAKRHNLYIIEDAAEAHGAEYKGRKVGSFGDIGCFSFYGNKIITTGEGGMCITNDKRLYERMKVLRDHGMNPKKRYWYDEIGFNYRMTNLQAAVGVAQMGEVDYMLKRKSEIRETYNHHLRELIDEGVITPPPSMPWAEPVCWLYSALINSDRLSKAEIISQLEKEGIETRPFFYPLHEMPPYRDDNKKYAVSTYLSHCGMSLPSGVKIIEKEISKVAEVIKRGLVE